MLKFLLNGKLKKLNKLFPNADKIYHLENKKGIQLILSDTKLEQSILKKIRDMDLEIAEINIYEDKLEIRLKPTLKIMSVLWVCLALELLIVFIAFV